MNSGGRRQESVGSMKRRLPDLLAVEFTHFDGQRIAIHEVPGVPPELAIHIGDESRRAVQAKRFPSSQRHSDDGVEADKVVHVRMGYEQISRSKEPRGA